MPRHRNSTTPNPLLEKRRGLYGWCRAWRPANNSATDRRFFSCLLDNGLLCRVTGTAPPPTPSLKKGGGFMAGAGRGVRQATPLRIEGLFLACWIYGLLCRIPETAPPPTPSLKKGGGFMAGAGRGVRQATSAADRSITLEDFSPRSK
jgi:hypothetical protein